MSLSAKLLLYCVLATCGWSQARAADDPLAAQRQAFLKAHTAALAGVEPSSNDSEQLRNYPLYPYLEAARIQRALQSTSADLESVDQRAEEFLSRFNREPVTREIRRTWLANLAKRRAWDKFLAHYRDEAADDTQRCQSFAARIDLQRTDQLMPAVARHWLTPRSLPACDQAFEWLRTQNALQPELIEQRARAALSRGSSDFARQLVVLLPAERAAPLNRWIALLDSPERTIDTLIGLPNEAVEPEALLAGFKRLARKDTDAAVLRFDAMQSARRWTPEVASPYALTVALSLAWDRRPEALQYFAKVIPADFDDEGLEWQARAALWAGDWPTVARTITAMSEPVRQSARWRYWKARAAEQQQDQQLARQLYEGVLLDDNFYSAMAGARLSRPVVPHQKKLNVDAAKLEEIEQLPGMIRARELYRCKLRPQALAEWNFIYTTLTERARIQAIHLSSRWGWHDQAISVAAQRGIYKDYKLLYPRPYRGVVRSAAKETGLEAELIYGVMRQESLYRSDAVSPAGARGLLQLLPETAQRMARTLKKPKPHPDDLFKPEVNILLGASQLRALTDRFDGMRIMALAGYNAGPNAARRWRPERPIDSDIWIENIPYNETRGYVQRVLWHTLVFGWLRTGEAQKTNNWIARVAPTDDGTLLSRNEATDATAVRAP